MATQIEKKSKQSSEARNRQKGVPFYPPGCLHYPRDLLRSRLSLGECLAELEQELAATWPLAFLQVYTLAVLHSQAMATAEVSASPPRSDSKQSSITCCFTAILQLRRERTIGSNRCKASERCLQVFENGASLVVVSFDAAAAQQEGDLTGYMNELARLNSVPGSWQLCKSTANWGQEQVLPASACCILVTVTTGFGAEACAWANVSTVLNLMLTAQAFVNKARVTRCTWPLSMAQPGCCAA